MRASSRLLGGTMIVLVTIVGGLAVLVSLEPPAPRAMAQSELPAGPSPVVSAEGRIESISGDRDLGATAVGSLTYVAAEGERVSEGEIIAEIDNRDLKAQLTAAEARVKIRERELERLNNGAREQVRREAAAAVAEADAALRLAQVVLQRKDQLARSGDASKEALDYARSSYETSVAHKEVLAERLALLLAPPRPEDVAIAEANLAVARADAEALKAAIEKTRLRSPVDGVLLRRFKALGETVTTLPPTLIATVGDTSHLRVRAEVDEADVGKVQVGQRAWVTADAFPGQRFKGTVSQVGQRVGRKEIRTDTPTEKVDTRVLEVLIQLDGSIPLPVGLRVDAFFEAPKGINTASIEQAH